MAISTDEAKVATPSGEPLMTVGQFMDLSDDGRSLELVRGRVVEMSPPNFLRGVVCSKDQPTSWQLRRGDRPRIFSLQ